MNEHIMFSIPEKVLTIWRKGIPEGSWSSRISTLMIVDALERLTEIAPTATAEEAASIKESFTALKKIRDELLVKEEAGRKLRKMILSPEVRRNLGE